MSCKKSATIVAVLLTLSGSTSHGLYARVQTPAQTAVISGIVVRAGVGDPLKRARVNLRWAGAASSPISANGSVQQAAGPPNTEAVTDDTGRFVFNGVVPGQYRLSADRDGYLHQEFGQRSLISNIGTTITVASGQQVTNIDFQMIPTGSISGRILNEDGEPLPDVQVQAEMRNYQQGRRVLTPAGRTGQTNDLGEFRISSLNPGEYYITAVTRSRPLPPINPVVTQRAIPQRGSGGSFSVGGSVMGVAVSGQSGESYPPVYFPGTPYPESATMVQLAPGGDVRGIEFAFHPVPTTSVRGQVIVPSSLADSRSTPIRPSPGVRGNVGEPSIPQATVVLARITSSLAALSSVVTMIGQNRAQVRPDSSFELTNVIPGSYNLLTYLQANGLDYSAQTRIEVGDRGVENVSLTLRPAVSIRGFIAVDGAPPAAFDMSKLRVVLQPDENTNLFLPIGRPATAQAQADGTFELTNVSAVPYRLSLAIPVDGIYLKAGRIGNDDAVNRPFTVSDSQDVSLQLQLGVGTGQVRGTVVDDKGNPYSGVLATLIPDEPARSRRDLYRSAPTDQYGHFSFGTNIAPGGYKLFAWEDISGTAYQDPEFIQRFEASGVSIKVDAGGSVQQQVPVTRPQQ